jgi:pilus assembly protein Flp/PilA
LQVRVYTTLDYGPYIYGGERSQQNLTVGEIAGYFFEVFLRRSGATAIEYGLIAAGISLAIIAVVNGLGANLNTKFTDINNSLK